VLVRLYLRWPRRALSWRAWLTLDVRLKGRSFLWGLHSVVGTWVLLCFLLAALTGLFWSYTWYRDGVYALTVRRVRTAVACRRTGRRGSSPSRAGGPGPCLARLHRCCAGLAQREPALPERAGQPCSSTTWMPPRPRTGPHRLQIDADGTVRRHERHADLAPGAQLVAAVYPLHSGNYFGLPGRLIVMAASLSMPLFAVTGWLLYLDRRRKQRAARTERRRQLAPGGSDAAPWLVGYATRAAPPSGWRGRAPACCRRRACRSR